MKGQTTIQDELPQGDQEVAEDKANNKWEEEMLEEESSHNGNGCSEDVDLKETDDRHGNPSDVSSTSGNDRMQCWTYETEVRMKLQQEYRDCLARVKMEQEYEDLLEDIEGRWKKQILNWKLKLLKERWEHKQAHDALMEQLNQLEHDNNTLASKVHAYEEDSRKWVGQKNYLIEKLNATNTALAALEHDQVVVQDFADSHRKWEEEKNLLFS